MDEKYYQAIPSRSLSERLTIAARDRIYDDFIRCCRPAPEDTILDVGVSDVVNDAANLLERRYPHPDRITALGLGHGEDFRAAFPHTAYTRIEPNRRLPFDDRAFAIAGSNAVLEHVGGAGDQAFFVSELMRVARKVFITVPNRYFPVEHHTAIPVLHFWDATFAPACRWLGKDEWADEKNLILMTRERLASLGPAGATIDYTGLRLGPFSSNLILFVDQTDPSLTGPEPA
ncbi:MAG TPA: methyltransferase [Methylomirabilota bacterium]|nr:methyltransferase [Methylomirabilota bacterium]